MKRSTNYKQTVGALTILAGILSAACIMLGAHAVEYNFDAFSDPTLVLQYAHNNKWAYWFLLLDMAGYYLLLLPAIFYLHQQYKYHSPWEPLFSFSGIAYVLIGAIGAVMLAATWPNLMQQSLSASTTDKDSIEHLFVTVTQIVTKGLWNMLESLFAATWWIGLGVVLRKNNKLISILSVIAGLACLSNALGTILEIKLVAELGVNVYLVMGIAWPIVLGVQLVRKSSHQSSFDPGMAKSPQPNDALTDVHKITVA